MTTLRTTEHEIQAQLRRISKRKITRIDAIREAMTYGYNVAHEDQMQMRIRDAQEQRVRCQTGACQREQR